MSGMMISGGEQDKKIDDDIPVWDCYLKRNTYACRDNGTPFYFVLKYQSCRKKYSWKQKKKINKKEKKNQRKISMANMKKSNRRKYKEVRRFSHEEEF
jgi:hypothetical protein